MLKFKGYCAANNISQKEISELLGITIQSANAKLNGRQDFTTPQVRTLCTHYGISADYYFFPESCKNVTEWEGVEANG